MKNNYQNADMLDMIFEHRNKSYGAYALRRDYNKSVKQAIFIMFSSLTLLFTLKFMSEKLKSETPITPQKEVILDLIPGIAIEKKNEIIEITEPKASQSQAVSTQRNTEMRVIANNHEASDSIPTVEEMRNIDPGVTSQITANIIGVTDGVGDEASIVPTVPLPAPPAFYISPEVMPEFPGGDLALMNFIRLNTRYPDRERELGIEGKTFVRFIVNEQGKVTNAEILKSESSGFNRESLRVVSKLPEFKPGMQQGRAVKVQLVLPFVYKLEAHR